MSSFYHDPTTACRTQSTCQEGDLACNHASEILSIDSDKQQTQLKNDIEKIELPSCEPENNQEPCEVSRRRSTFDEKDKRIQELTAELRVKKRLSAVYREQLLGLMKDVDGHNEHLSLKVKVVRNNLKKLEGRNGNI
ncbi:hypothetical protein L2E82_29251 [Cichorium intybus]|uniref:Uncharacterized protein n=1 Tax=Cichorium intybus TaxID=13427 RepID=A0ACB9CXK4_CICIN|nr:hypothetical protein L2E82_29251 [Cichorium intybus]